MKQLRLPIRALKSLILLVIIVFGCQAQSLKGSIQARVIDCIDGDTIKLEDGTMVRYIGIDTPELHKKEGQNWEDVNEAFALEAKLLNEQLVKNKLVKLEFDVERKDKYSRLLAYCFVDNIFVNERILEEGLGLFYTRPPNQRYVGILVSAQKKARGNQKGIWGKELFITPEEACKYIGSVATLEGVVLKVTKTDKVIYLNFGRDYKKDFTVVIFKQDLPSFIAEGINPVSFKGKTLRVFGKIKEYNGPEIICRHPSQIEILR